MAVRAGVVVKGKEAVVLNVFRGSEKVPRSCLKLSEESEAQGQSCFSPVQLQKANTTLHQYGTPLGIIFAIIYPCVKSCLKEMC